MADFLLELLSEEIPARMQPKASADLARLFQEQLAGAGLAAEAIETYATPRRLALIARGLPPETDAASEEIKGPRATAPEQALEGFLRKTGLTRDQLVDRDGVFFAVIDRPGRATADVLAEAIPAIIRAFPWPKSMRWGEASHSTESQRWVRPLQGIVALLDDAIVDFEVAGLRSGAATIGHRFHHPGTITIGGVSDYAEKLRACHVIVDPAERRAIIHAGATRAAADAGLILVEDEGLLAENAGLTEWPVPLLGSFDPAFLEVPREVIQLTMRTNQKYFACTNPPRNGEGDHAKHGGGAGTAGSLAPNFVCVANLDAADGGARIVEGNRKVLAARLSDAKFFWENDLQVPLEEQAQKLDQIVFHEKLGTVAERVERVAAMARGLAEEGIVKGAAPALAERAARLCKADLVTQMVGEFPELQGLIGGYLARAQGEPDEVADAIRDHYKPIGQEDEVPTAPITVAVSLADKLDTLIQFFAIGLPPTGSRDPFALRRAALSAIALVTANALRLNLTPVFGRQIAARNQDRLTAQVGREPSEKLLTINVQESISLASLDFEQLNQVMEKLTAPLGQLAEELEAHADRAAETIQDCWIRPTQALLDFFADRLKVQQREAGVRHDLIDAVFALGGEDDLVRLLARVRALQSFVETPEGADLLAGYKRAANILKKENWTATTAEASHNPAPEEAALIAALDAAEPHASDAIAREDFEGAMAALASLRAPVDAFFDKVTVNDPDPPKREARLNLLTRMRDAVHRVADFSRIEG